MTGNIIRSWDTERTDDTDLNVIVCDFSGAQTDPKSCCQSLLHVVRVLRVQYQSHK
jgi:hypothetical protein